MIEKDDRWRPGAAEATGSDTADTELSADSEQDSEHREQTLTAAERDTEDQAAAGLSADQVDETTADAAAHASTTPAEDDAKGADAEGEAEPGTDSATGSSEPEEQPQAKEQPEAPPAAPKAGRGLAVFALLIALLACGGAGYLYYELVYLNPLASLESDNQARSLENQAETANLRDALSQFQQQTQRELQSQRTAQTDTLNDYESAVRKSLQEALQAAPPSRREWQLAEAEYLLRIGNHRVLMEQDSQGGLELLLAADRILAELDDFALHGVRARLADEIIALKQVPRTDLQGVYLRLEALKQALAELGLNRPERAAETVALEEPSTLQQFAAMLKDLVRVRTLEGDETLAPLLSNTEEQYLELNMRLSIEQSQLAALKRHQAVYEASLGNLRTWLTKYVDAEGEPLIAEIDDLLTFQLQQDLPDISGSLSQLLQARSGGQ
ncbi:MAG: uroporphyrinogen-III C-methyltransferase [Pseudomonadota bacterium]